MLALRELQVSPGNGFDPEPPIPGLHRLQTAYTAVKEVPHSAIGVVVQGRFPDAAVRLNGTPLLPDGGRALMDGVQPRRVAVLQKQLVCLARKTVVRQGEQRSRSFYPAFH